MLLTIQNQKLMTLKTKIPVINFKKSLFLLNTL